MPDKPQQKHRTNRVFKSLHLAGDVTVMPFGLLVVAGGGDWAV